MCSVAAAASRADALRLFRRCLRTAKRCPSHEHQETWGSYARIKFRAGRSWRDRSKIKAGLADGLEQCERLEYFQRAKGLLPPLKDETETDISGAKPVKQTARPEHPVTLSSSSSVASTAASSHQQVDELAEVLARLCAVPPDDAAAYARALVAAGYETEEALRLDATEADLAAAGLKIGHVRRVLRCLRAALPPPER